MSTAIQPLPDYSQRHKIARDTIARSQEIIKAHQEGGASPESQFHKDQLPPLNPTLCPGYEASKVQIVNQGAFALARDIIKGDRLPEGKMAVLNLASDEAPGGGWEYSLSTTQEEALCYSSTLYVTLHESYYPWPNLGPGSVAGVYSPGVVIFKDDLDGGCVDLPLAEQHVVSVITVAAPRSPSLTKDHLSFKNKADIEYLREKIRLVLRMAAHGGKEYLVLGAMGCGAYRCPPQFVADEMKSVLLAPEFKGWFKRVVFAVYSRQDSVGSSNYDIFEKTFRDVTM